MKRLPLIALLLFGCATTGPATNGGTATSPSSGLRTSGNWMPSLLAATRSDPESTILRARARLRAAGFETNLAELMGEPATSHELLVADDRRDSGRCFGTTEVIAVNARPHPMGTLLQLSCVTAAWSEPSESGASCEHTQQPGCPVRGDRALAALATDAVSSL